MKKRAWILLCLALLVAAALLPAAAMADTTRYVYTSNGKTLNMRSEPQTNADNVIAHIPYGAAVSVLKKIGYIDWSYVEYEGRSGYVMNRYLVDRKPAPKSPEKSDAPAKENEDIYAGFKAANYSVQVHASTPGGHVNLRWAPSKQANVEAKIADGAMLRVIAENETWAQVVSEDDMTVGFMMRYFLHAVEASDVEG